MFSRLHPFLKLTEAGLIGLFFIQALRFLIGSLYSRIASASLVSAYPAGTITSQTPGFVDTAVLSGEITLLGLILVLPVITLLLGRMRFMFIPAVLLTAAGRALMIAPNPVLTATTAAEIAVGGGLLYITLLISHRAQLLPYLFILGFAGDQLIRAFGNTLDLTFDPIFFNIQIILSVVVSLLSLLTALPNANNLKDESGDNRSRVDPNRGLLTLWGAFGLGGLLFLEISLLALPNAIIGRAGTGLYQPFVTLTLLMTLLPLIPFVRTRARRFIAPFDSSTRGWIWLVILALLLVIGTRIQQLPIPRLGLLPIGGLALLLAQFSASMLWWWVVRPKADNERNFGGLWLISSVLIFGSFIMFDLFTYEYAFVQDFAPPLDALNTIVPPLLRGFRGLGLGIILIAALVAALPMIQATRRIPWTGGSLNQSFIMVVVVAGLSGIGAFAARPPQVIPVIDVNEIRIGTYNIHAGYSEFFNYDLEAIARTIQQSGAEVVLLQEVEVGRLTSFGVDQALWLARRLGMDRRFYATSEGIRGLAVLSRVPIVFDDGELLPSTLEQAGLQRVQIQPGTPDEGAITIYNTSLGLLLAGESQQEQERNQREQLSRILEIIALHIDRDYGGQLGRAVLGGTFHNVPGSPLLQSLSETGFVDPFAGTNLELSATLRRVNLPLARYDYLWLWSQTLTPTGANVMRDSVASDHRMAVVGVQIRSGQ